MTLTSETSSDDVTAAPAAQATDLRKTYGSGQAAVHALAGITVTFERGRFTAVMGPSGSGKSTLMHCMAGLDRPTSGQVLVGGQDIGKLDDGGLTRLRRDPRGAAYADRVIFLADGTVVGELEKPTADSVLERMRTLGTPGA
jgi:putative ABC transport system ATP-binding protein